MKMDLRVVRIDAAETAALTESEHFNRLAPTKCTACGSTGPFTRQVFRIHGVPESKQRDDGHQEAVRHILFHQHNVGHVCFKTYQNDFYSDSAICCKCRSPEVEFDIEFTDDLLASMAALSGQSAAEIKVVLETTANVVRNQTRAEYEG